MPDQNHLLRALSPALLDKLKPRLRRARGVAGDTLFLPGERITNVTFPVSGAISLVTELSDGRMIESAMVGRDSVVGGGAALNGRDATYKAIVQVAGETYSLAIEIARSVANESEEFR